MPSNNTQTIDQRGAILELLKSSSVPLTSGELRTRLLATSVRLPEYQVLSHLRNWQKEGEVRFERGRWYVSGLERYKTTTQTHTVAPQNNPPISKTAVPKPRDKPTIGVGWTPSTSKYFTDSYDYHPPAPTPSLDFQKPDFSGPWGMFRKLLRYYSDCVRNDARSEAKAYLSRLGTDFMFLTQVGSWFPKPGIQWQLPLCGGEHLETFKVRVAGLAEEGVLLLGYPTHVFSKQNGPDDSYCIVRPIFTYSLRWQIHHNNLVLGTDYSIPDINIDWLEFMFKSDPEKQRAFLYSCGLMNHGASDESLEDNSRFMMGVQPDLDRLALAVTGYFGPRIREPLRPQSVSSYALGEYPESGIYNRAVVMIGDRTRYTRSLLRELNLILKCKDEELDQTALRHIFKRSKQKLRDFKRIHEDVKENPKNLNHEGIVVDTCKLNGDQRRAVASLLTETISVITGPPGTGKSQVVGAAICNLRIKEETVIFSSRNHKAIDAVEKRVVTSAGQPLLVRGNSKEDPYLKVGFVEVIKDLLRKEYDLMANDQWSNHANDLKDRLKTRAELAVIATKIIGIRQELEPLEEELSQLSEGWLPAQLEELYANYAKFPGKVVQRLSIALKPLRSLPEKLSLFETMCWWFSGFGIRRSARTITNQLNRFFQSWSLGMPIKGVDSFRDLFGSIENLENARKFCEKYPDVSPLRKELRLSPPIDEVTQSIRKQSEEIEALAVNVLKLDLARRLGLPPDADRESLASLKAALEGLDHAVSDEQARVRAQEELNKAIVMLLSHSPAWAITNLSVGSRFPLSPGMFDLAVIDEASQCDIASAIPIIFRAKRVGVVGDPFQLSHSTKIKGSRDALLRKRNHLTEIYEQRFAYPNASLYDLFDETNGVSAIFLSDHYRCVEEIAEYANQTFYGSRLRVVTSGEGIRVPKGFRAGIEWTDVVSEIRPGGPSGCIAPKEVEAVVGLLKKIQDDGTYAGTLGVVTPFRQQANRLMDAIQKELSYSFRTTSKLIIDTASGFQGDERDTIIMSLCAGFDMPPGSRHYMKETANLMNVAITRGRAVVHIVGNKSWAVKCGMVHIEKLARPSSSPPVQREKIQSQWYPHESPWEKVLYEALKKEGLDPEPQRPALGRRLDLVLVKSDLKIDIEVDGDGCHRNPDGTRKVDDVWRDIQLQGAGWKVMRFWVYQLREDLDKCVKEIKHVWR